MLQLTCIWGTLLSRPRLIAALAPPYRLTEISHYPAQSALCSRALNTVHDCSLFIAVLALFIVVLIKAAEKVEEKAREDENDHGDAAEERILSTGTDSQ